MARKMRYIKNNIDKINKGNPGGKQFSLTNVTMYCIIYKETT